MCTAQRQTENALKTWCGRAVFALFMCTTHLRWVDYNKFKTPKLTKAPKNHRQYSYFSIVHRNTSSMFLSFMIMINIWNNCPLKLDVVSATKRTTVEQRIDISHAFSFFLFQKLNVAFETQLETFRFGQIAIRPIRDEFEQFGWAPHICSNMQKWGVALSMHDHCVYAQASNEM